MAKKFAVVALLLFGVSSQPVLATEIQNKIILAENETNTQAEAPKDQTVPQSSTQDKKEDPKKTGNKKAGDEPSCDN